MPSCRLTLTEVDTFYTSAEGYLITPEKLDQGNYQLVEVQAPYGYVLHDEPISFKVDDDDAVYDDIYTYCFETPAGALIELNRC